MAIPESPHLEPADGSAEYRVLPPVSDLVRAALAIVPELDPALLTTLVQEYLGRQRLRVAAGARPSRQEIERDLERELLALRRPRLAPVLNATGILIHTNLGRSPVSAATAAAMAAAAANPVALELEPETNQRGGRMREISELMRLLTGAEATLVVNNGAAAVLLAVSALAAGGEVVVSRGEVVEIGGGFRIPDVIQQSGAGLVEVGTTNRTYVTDYARATGESTAAYLRVHPSNFTLSGFVHRVSTRDLAHLATERGLPLIEDLGSGALLDSSAYGLTPEPTIGASLAAGATLVTASGDKLLGGPQAGIICGPADLVERVARHPLARAVRADKTCLAGIATTLRHYARGEAERAIPIWRMIAATPERIRSRADAALALLVASGAAATVVSSRASVGGGSLPGQELASSALAFAGRVDELARRLRLGQPGVFGRIEGNRLLLDFRSILPEDDELLIEAVQRAMAGDPPEGVDPG